MIIREWPYGFLDDYWRCIPGSYRVPDLSIRELIGSIEYVLAVSGISERDNGIIHERYRKLLPYREIAENNGLSESRVRIIVQNSLRRLRHPKYEVILAMGVAAYTRQRYKVAVDKTLESLVEERLRDQRMKDFRYWCKRYRIPEGKIPVIVSQPTVPSNAGIEELDLSIRAYNCLAKNNITTIDQLLALDKQSLMQIKNLGKASYWDIIRCLEKCGYDPAWLK